MRRLPSAIRARIWPHLKDFGLQYGQESFLQYYRRFYQGGTVPHPDFSKALYEESCRLYPDADLKQLQAQLGKAQYFCSAGHAGIENPSVLIAGALLTGAAAAQTGNLGIWLTCSALTPRHPSCPAGFYLSLRPDQGLAPRPRLRFLTDRFHQTFVPNFAFLEEKYVLRRLTQAQSDFRLRKAEVQAIQELTAKLIREGKDFLNGHSPYNCADALLRLNRSLYRRFLANMQAPCTPDVLVLDIDRLSIRLMLQDLNNPDSDFTAFLKDHTLLTHLLTGMNGCTQVWEYGQASNAPHFSEHTTVLFYHLLPKLKYERLSALIRPGMPPLLIGKSGYQLELNAPALAAALARGELHPNIFCTNFYLAFFKQVTLSGGIYFYQYVRQLLSRPAVLLGLPLPTAVTRNLIQSYPCPIKVQNPDPQATGTLNAAWALDYLDLYSQNSPSAAELKQILQSPIKDSLPLSALSLMLDFELQSAEEVGVLEPQLLQLLQAQAPLTLTAP